jgi:hypothetical protein
MRTASLPIQVRSYTVGAKDQYGRPAKTWGSPVDEKAYAFDPGGSFEPFYPGREKVITTPTLFAPHSLVVTAQDRITVRGKEYEVTGDPAYWESPAGKKLGVTIPLKKVEG